MIWPFLMSSAINFSKSDSGLLEVNNNTSKWFVEMIFFSFVAGLGLDSYRLCMLIKA